MELLYEDQTEIIRQAAYEVHKYFGTGFLEKVYENALKYKLEKKGLQISQQCQIPVYFIDNFKVGDYYADLMVEKKIIIELKTASTLDPIHFAQVKNYLKATEIKLGLLINFGTPKLQFKRIIL
ncbi:MAG: GxxExxY protein [Candidatus Cloacimonetes bacterium]|nr:GxxExxY protein [Candidatus Cloacimonadota bacterium]